jgi:hypothetical protein
VWCGFVVVVREVAVGDNIILVKVESPRRATLGQREEWLLPAGRGQRTRAGKAAVATASRSALPEDCVMNWREFAIVCLPLE